MSFAPRGVLETGFTAEYFGDDTDFSEEEAPLDLPLLNEEGFVLKTSPSTQDVSRIGFTEKVRHTVVSGDTLSGIASLYGISVKTLIWENNISEFDSLRISQVLNIPSVDGVTHTVKGPKETLSTIAKVYGVEQQLIKDHNKLESDTIQKGDQLFIPGGKKQEVAQRQGVRGSTRAVAGTFNKKVVIATDDTPDAGKLFIFPTVGRITQGFSRSHYAYDIGNPSKPDIWAVASGTVITASGGCPPREVKVDRRCGSGYGNYVVIDHGNGVQTLYGHMEVVYVSEGQQVAQGQAIGEMGSSGRTYGSTGIHLHFEVRDNGVKKNPGKYF